MLSFKPLVQFSLKAIGTKISIGKCELFSKGEELKTASIAALSSMTLPLDFTTFKEDFTTSPF